MFVYPMVPTDAAVPRLDSTALGTWKDGPAALTRRVGLRSSTSPPWSTARISLELTTFRSTPGTVGPANRCTMAEKILDTVPRRFSFEVGSSGVDHLL